MKIQKPSFVVLYFFCMCLTVTRAQTFERSWLHEHGLNRYSRERRRLHGRHAPEEEDNPRSSSHHPHQDGRNHGRKSDQSSGSKSREGPKGHSKSKKGQSSLSPKRDSSKSKKKGGTMSHSSKSKRNGGPKSRSSKSQGASKEPENVITTMESRKDDLKPATPARVAIED